MNFRAKSVVAFLLVPWMPMLFIPVYIWMRGFYQNRSESFLTDALGISLGFGLAFLYSFLIIGILTGPGIVVKKDLSVLVLLCAFIGAAEASTFWPIVRPDKLTANKIVVEQQAKSTQRTS